MKNYRNLFVLLLVVAVMMFVAAGFAQEKAPGQVVLKSSMGGVKFDHAAHVKTAGKCDTCHHAAKEGKALKSPHEACTDCHTLGAAAPAAPVKANAKTAMHANCIECHKKEAKGPQKCTECHDKTLK